ncbi:hypothetical protein FHG87_006638 [Trinorchestia longiramus]|nr:hypothetical protein FHG87_006638 [Trinorchestia longiramus]
MNEKKFVGLSGEYKRFGKVLKPLRKLHKETFQAISNVSECEDLTPEQVGSFSASIAEVAELQHLLHAPLTIIITGQDNYGKVVVLTKLLGTRLLPFAGPQHTCNTVDSSSFIHSSSFDGGLCTSRAEECRKNSASKHTVTASSSLKCPDELLAKTELDLQRQQLESSSEKQERPWRGIRISFSSSQVTYSVVRPETVRSSCKCDGDENKLRSQEISAPTNTPSSLLLSVPNNMMSSRVQAVSDSNSEQTTVRVGNSSEEPKEKPSVLDSAPPLTLPLSGDMTVAQLEDLLEHKFQSHLKQRNCSESEKNLSGPENSVKEVPLSEIELTSEHLQDPILRDALLDVGLNHCLLKEQLQIVVTPSINKYKCSKDPRNESCFDHSLGGSSSNNGAGVPTANEEDHNVAHKAEAKDSPQRSVPMDIPCTRIIPPTPQSEAPDLASLASGNKCRDMVDALIDTHSPSLVFGTPASSVFPSNVSRSTPSVPSSRSGSRESLCSFKSLPIECSMYHTPNASSMPFSRKLFSYSVSPESSELLTPTLTSTQACGSSKVSGLVESRFSRIDTNPAISDADSCKPVEPSVVQSTVLSPKATSSLNGGLAEGISPQFIERPPRTGDSSVNCSMDSVSVSDENCMGFMGTLLPHVNAVILYAITKDHFTSQNLDELQEIRDHSPPCPVMFVRVPPILDVLSELPADQQRSLLIDTGILKPLSVRPSEAEGTAPVSACENPSLAHAKLSFSNKSSTKKTITKTDQKSKMKEVVSENDNEASKVQNKTVKSPDVEAGAESPRQNFNVNPMASEISTAVVVGERPSSPKEYPTPDGCRNERHPMMFVMDSPPVMEASPGEVKPVKSKTVKFTDDARDNERKSARPVVSPKSSDSRLGKRDKNCITAGNCSEAFSGEEAEKIRKLTSDIYKQAQKERDNILPSATNNFNLGQTEDESERDLSGGLMKSIIKKPSSKNWCKMPYEILRVLSEELGFLSEDGSAGLHVAHCHLTWKDVNMSEIARNPFVQTYNKKYNFPVEQTVLSDSSFLGDSYSDSDDGALSSDLAELECSELCVECGIIESFADFDKLHLWTKRILRSHVAYTSELLGKIQGRCLSSFVVFAFEFSRQLQISPRRLAYARQQEEQLYEDLLAVARDKEENIRLLIARTLNHDRCALLRTAQNLALEGGAGSWESSVQECVLREVNNRVGEQLVRGVQGLRENCLGTLRRCLAQLEQHCSTQRDQSSLSLALKKLVNAAYQVEVRPTSSWGLLRGMWERIRELLSGGGPTARADEETSGRHAAPGTREWKRQVASDMIKGLSEKRLARTISTQISGEIKAAHSLFLSNMELLEHQLTDSLANTEHQQHQLKSVHAPKLAKLALHTDAMNNRVKYGLPVLGGELGRGHFGVVYSCKGWARYTPCAVKTLLPRDPTQWRDIALQYHYTSTTPGTVPSTTPGTVPSTTPGTVPGTTPDTVPGTTPGTVPGTTPGTVPGTTSGTVPGTTPGTVPGTTPGTVPGTTPGTVPDTTPGTVPDTTPGTVPYTTPGTVPYTTPGTVPYTTPGTVPGTTPGAVPGTTPGTVPGTTPGAVPGTTPGAVPGTTPGAVPGTTPGAVPGTTPGAVPGTTPGAVPGTTPGTVPNTTPGAVPGTTPGAVPGTTPGAVPGTTPGAVPGTTPGTVPGTTPGAVPGTTPGAVPGTTPGTVPNTTPGAVPGTTPGAVLHEIKACFMVVKEELV